MQLEEILTKYNFRSFYFVFFGNEMQSNKNQQECSLFLT